MPDLVPRRPKTLLQLRGGISPAADQAFLQLPQRGRRQKDRHQRVPQIGVGRRAGADGGGALDVDIEQDIPALAEFVEHTCRTPLLFEPGAKVSYQSMGILMAAAIVEKITGEPLPAFLKENIFDPLRMTRTSLGLGGRKISDMAQCQVDHPSDWDWNSNYWRNTAAPWSARELAATGSGIGIASLRRRIELVHGTLRAGRSADGGYCLEATMPAFVPTTDPVA